MKLLFNYISVVIFILFVSLQSCKDEEYSTDNLNRNIEINIPPVPLGSLDTIFVPFLDIVPPDLSIGYNFAVSHTIRGVFNEATISRFFYEGSNDVVISAQLDAMVMPSSSGLQIDLILNIVDEDKTLNQFIKIPAQRVISSKNQTIEIRIKGEYMKYMKNARDINFTFGFNVDRINFTPNDYIFIRRLILHSGGIQVQI